MKYRSILRKPLEFFINRGNPTAHFIIKGFEKGSKLQQLNQAINNIKESNLEKDQSVKTELKEIHERLKDIVKRNKQFYENYVSSGLTDELKNQKDEKKDLIQKNQQLKSDIKKQLEQAHKSRPRGYTQALDKLLTELKDTYLPANVNYYKNTISEKNRSNLNNKLVDIYQNAQQNHAVSIVPIEQSMDRSCNGGHCGGYARQWIKLMQSNGPERLRGTFQTYYGQSTNINEHQLAEHIKGNKQFPIDESVSVEQQYQIGGKLYQYGGPNNIGEPSKLKKTGLPAQATDGQLWFHKFNNQDESMGKFLRDALKHENALSQVGLFGKGGVHGIGLGKYNGQCHFFDANSGWYQFKDQEGLKRFLKHYFQQMGYFNNFKTYMVFNTFEPRNNPELSPLQRLNHYIGDKCSAVTKAISSLYGNIKQGIYDYVAYPLKAVNYKLKQAAIAAISKSVDKLVKLASPNIGRVEDQDEFVRGMLVDTVDDEENNTQNEQKTSQVEYNEVNTSKHKSTNYPDTDESVKKYDNNNSAQNPATDYSVTSMPGSESSEPSDNWVTETSTNNSAENNSLKKSRSTGDIASMNINQNGMKRSNSFSYLFFENNPNGQSNINEQEKRFNNN